MHFHLLIANTATDPGASLRASLGHLHIFKALYGKVEIMQCPRSIYKGALISLPTFSILWCFKVYILHCEQTL